MEQAGVRGSKQKHRRQSLSFQVIHLLLHSLIHHIGHRLSLVLLTMAANVLIPILFPLSDELEYANGKSKSEAPCKITCHFISLFVFIVCRFA